MVALHEALLIVRVEVKHSIPNRRVVFAGRAVRLERDKRLRLMVRYHLQIVARQIDFIRRYLRHREVAPGGLNQSGKLLTVVSVGLRNFDAGNDVGFDTTHQVNLDPFVPIDERSIRVLRFDPLNKAASAKAGTVNREVRFGGLQRQTGFLDRRCDGAAVSLCVISRF